MLLLKHGQVEECGVRGSYGNSSRRSRPCNLACDCIAIPEQCTGHYRSEISQVRSHPQQVLEKQRHPHFLQLPVLLVPIPGCISSQATHQTAKITEKSCAHHAPLECTPRQAHKHREATPCHKSHKRAEGVNVQSCESRCLKVIKLSPIKLNAVSDVTHHYTKLGMKPESENY